MLPNGITRIRSALFPNGMVDSAHWSLSLLVRLRFLHVLFELALLWPALRFGWMFPADVPWYVAALAALLLFNFLSLAWSRNGLRVSPGFLFFQILVDLTATTVLFALSGGLTNPIHSVLHFQIGLAGIVLPTRPALLSLALGCGALAILGSATQSLGEAYAWIGPLGPNLAYEWVLAAAVSCVSIFAARLNRHYRQRLEEAQRRGMQQDRLRAAGAVASGFCHELASPLNAAGLIADRLQRKTSEPVSPDLSEEWRELRESLTRCDAIVRSMAGVPWDPDALSLQTTDAAVLLPKIIREWNGPAPVHYTVRDVVNGTPSNGTLFVTAPPVGLGQTVISLLRNAEEASPATEPVDVCVQGDRASVSITVSDRGAGVDPAVLRGLGSPFNSRKGTGRGLGLFAALHFAESVGGALSFRARAGGGTEAILTLPRAGMLPQEDPA
jgi:two-component system sensor histidine kinase RegB